MNAKKFFSTFFTFFRLIYNNFALFLEFLSPYYDYHERSIRTIPRLELYYRALSKWVVKILLNALILWLALIFLHDAPQSPIRLSLGVVLLLWLFGELAKQSYDYYVDGRIKWTKELPSVRVTTK